MKAIKITETIRTVVSDDADEDSTGKLYNHPESHPICPKHTITIVCQKEELEGMVEALRSINNRELMMLRDVMGF